MLNYSKKLDKKIFILGLLIFTIFLLATTIQTDFAATNPINNTTNGGISGSLNSSSPGDIIELDEGTYTGNNNTNMTINKNITIQGKIKDRVILDAQGLSRIFLINNNLNVTFINITFINGNTSGNGGAIFGDYDNTLTFIDCIFINNSADAGGAIYSNSNFNINNSKFNGNHATLGGAIYYLVSQSGIFISNIINSTFNDNSVDTSGGAIIVSAYPSLSYSLTLNIFGCNFTNNLASHGGALYILNRNFVNLYIYDSLLSNNSAESLNGGGGAIVIINSANTGNYAKIFNVDISNSTFANNTGGNNSDFSGGGGILISSITNDSMINVNIYDSIFINNNGENGGAIFVSTGYNVENVIINLNIYTSSFMNNYVSNNGGAISSLIPINSSANISVVIDNCTFNGNSAGNNGGALSSNTSENSTGDSTFIVSGSDLSGNSAGNDGGAVSSSTGDGSSSDSTVIIDDSTINDNTAGNNGGALSSNTGENSTGNSIIIVIDSDIENNTAGNNGDTASATTGDGSTGDSEIDIIGDSTIINNDPNKDDDGIYTSTGENSTGSSEINIDDGVIKKLSSNSTIIVSNTVVGKTVVIRGVAIDENGNPLANIQLTINIDGVDYNVTTNALGEWSLNYTPSSPGTITVTVDLNENNKYYAFTNTTDFNVAKANTRSTIIISNAKSGKSTIIRGVLIDENGNTIANAPINVIIGGKSHNLVTGADGSWSLSYTPLKAGKFVAKVYYNGNSNYVASTSSLNYTVAQGTDAPKKTDIRLLKKKSSKVFRHGKRVVMKWYTYKNYGATGSKNITTKVIIKNLKYKLWKVYNKKLSYKFGNNKIKFKLNLKSGEKFKLKLKVYKPIR